MAISAPVGGTISYSTGNPTPSYPTVAAGDMLLLFVGTKPDTAQFGSTPTGWRYLGGLSGGTGTSGIDTGPMRVEVFYRIATGSETGTLTVSHPSNNVSAAQIVRVRNATGEWLIDWGFGNDSSAGASISASATMSGNTTVANDMFVTCFVTPTDNATYASHAFSQTGITWGTITELNEWATSSGQDMGGVICYGSASSGTSSSTTFTYTATASGTTTNVAGPLAAVKVREVTNTAAASFTESWGSQDTTKWKWGSLSTVSGGKASIDYVTADFNNQFPFTAANNGARLIEFLDLTASQIVFKLDTPWSSDTGTSKAYIFLMSGRGTNIYAYADSSTTNTWVHGLDGSATGTIYSPDTYPYIRFALSSGTLTIAVSTNNSTWTNIRIESVTDADWANTVLAFLSYDGTNQATAGAALWGEANPPYTPPASLTDATWGFIPI